MIIRSTIYYYFSGIVSQLSLLAAWAILKTKIGLGDFGQFIYLIGILEFICTLGLLGFDSFIHRFASYINQYTLRIFQKVQVVYSIVLIAIATFSNIYLNLNYNIAQFLVLLMFVVSFQNFTVTNALLVAKERSLRSAAMQITKSLGFLLFVFITPEKILETQSFIISGYGLCFLISSLIFRLSHNNVRTLPDLRTKYKEYAPQFYFSSLVGIGYVVLFRTILQIQLDAELFGYFMFILMIFAQVNGLWTSAFKALLPSVFNQAQDEAWKNKLLQICFYLSFAPFIAVLLAQALPAITSLLDVQRYPHDAKLLVILVMSFASSGMVSLLSTIYYKNTQKLRLFFVSLASSVLTLTFMFVVSGMEDRFLYACLCVGSQWVLNYFAHAIGYREIEVSRSSLPIVILGVNTIFCIMMI